MTKIKKFVSKENEKRKKEKTYNEYKILFIL